MLKILKYLYKFLCKILRIKLNTINYIQYVK